MNQPITPKNLPSPQTFAFGHHALRVIMREGDPWFVASDVAKALGYNKTDHMLRLLDIDEKGALIVGTLGGPQEMAVINESGLNNAIFSSRKPEARAYRKWVTGEVLPSIRKTGRYAVPLRAVFRTSATVITREHELQAMQMFLEGQNKADIGRVLGMSRPSVARLLSGQHRFALGSGPDLTTPELRRAVAEREVQQATDRFAEQVAHKYCVSTSNHALQMEYDRQGRALLAALGPVLAPVLTGE